MDKPQGNKEGERHAHGQPSMAPISSAPHTGPRKRLSTVRFSLCLTECFSCHVWQRSTALSTALLVLHIAGAPQKGHQRCRTTWRTQKETQSTNRPTVNLRTSRPKIMIPADTSIHRHKRSHPPTQTYTHP